MKNKAFLVLINDKHIFIISEILFKWVLPQLAGSEVIGNEDISVNRENELLFAYNL